MGGHTVKQFIWEAKQKYRSGEKGCGVLSDEEERNKEVI